MSSRRCLIGLMFFLFTGLAITASAASKSDLAMEKQWQAQIIPHLSVGEAVKLKSAGIEFLSIYAENSSDEAVGGAIILHGLGLHPAWPEVVEPIRMTLPKHGWHTLSLQMPILANEASINQYAPLFDEVPDRIQAGVNYLKSKGIRNIVIIAHSIGVAMATHYLTKKPDPTVKALVAIGTGTYNLKDGRMNNIDALSKIKLPVLDIFGSEDFEYVLKNAGKRRAAGKKANNKAYKQMKIQGANHFFTNMNDVLIKRIRGWLAQNADGKEITIKKK